VFSIITYNYDLQKALDILSKSMSLAQLSIDGKYESLYVLSIFKCISRMLVVNEGYLLILNMLSPVNENE
ncbi:hypothetical protein THOM_1149, partial [Trachipleistophora hominis]